MRLQDLRETAKLPKRYGKTGVGKMIGGSLYVHQNYEQVIPQEILGAAKQQLDDFPYNIVKYAPSTGNVTFIWSPDFDRADEPVVGPALLIKPDGTKKSIKPSSDPWIYHHKWLFVKDDYPGFDVQASKQRSLQWMSLPNIDYSRIGKKSFWDRNVLPLLKDVQ